MKNACVRIRKLDGIIGINKTPKVDDKEIELKEKELISQRNIKILSIIYNLIIHICFFNAMNYWLKKM